MHEFFIRGWVDGDGCFYSRNSSSQFSVAGSYEQDWQAMEDLCEQLEIKYSISHRIHPNSKSSCLRITNKAGIKKFGEFIYQSRQDIGFLRKREAYIKSHTSNLKNGSNSAFSL